MKAGAKSGLLVGRLRVVVSRLSRSATLKTHKNQTKQIKGQRSHKSLISIVISFLRGDAIGPFSQAQISYERYKVLIIYFGFVAHTLVSVISRGRAAPAYCRWFGQYRRQ